eukprot:803949-Pelagomonas_calceolata.AAC.2
MLTEVSSEQQRTDWAPSRFKNNAYANECPYGDPGCGKAYAPVAAYFSASSGAARAESAACWAVSCRHRQGASLVVSTEVAQGWKGLGETIKEDRKAQFGTPCGGGGARATRKESVGQESQATSSDLAQTVKQG